MVTTLKPYKDPQKIKNIILDIAQKKGQVVYGQQAVNVQIPQYLKRKTKDYDIYTKKPKQSAEEVANKLNEYYGNKFKVVKGVNPSTYKVKKGKKTIADYTGTTKKPKYKKVLGVSYANLQYQKKKLKNILKKKEYEYRHLKAQKDLNKLMEAEKRSFLYS